jgi:hypothetical protein
VVSPYLRTVKAASGVTAALQLAGQSAGGRHQAVPAAVVSHVRQGDHP